MRNAKRFDARITVGRVPDETDMTQLGELGYRTLVDVREEDELFGGFVHRRAAELGMKYIGIPIQRGQIQVSDVQAFYKAVYEKGSAPLYVFSRYGKKPMAFLLLLEVVANNEPLVRVFRRASRMGMDLHGDLALRSFLVEFFNSGCMDGIVRSIMEYRPELVRKHEDEEARRVRMGMKYVSREERQVILGQDGCTVWLTGMPSSGKSTTAFALENELLRRGRLAYVIDSDNVRHGLNGDLGFTREDRAENIRRIGEVAKMFSDSGVIAITSFISPYRSDRQLVRGLHGAAGLGFLEVFVDAPADVCERRDSRGLYKKAREGEIHDFTGVEGPYEPPDDPDVVVSTDRMAPHEAAARIIDHLVGRGHVPVPR